MRPKSATVDINAPTQIWVSGVSMGIGGTCVTALLMTIASNRIRTTMIDSIFPDLSGCFAGL